MQEGEKGETLFHREPRLEYTRTDTHAIKRVWVESRDAVRNYAAIKGIRERLHALSFYCKCGACYNA